MKKGQGKKVIFSEDQEKAEIFASSSESAEREESGQKPKESPQRSRKAGKKCKCCGIFLSMYNQGNFCWPCDEAIERWNLFPANRSETRKEMAHHCLLYVMEQENSKKRKQ